jgi:hypothetical protein
MLTSSTKRSSPTASTITGHSLLGDWAGFPPPITRLDPGVQWAQRRPADGALIAPDRPEQVVNLVVVLKPESGIGSADGIDIYYSAAGKRYHMRTATRLRVVGVAEAMLAEAHDRATARRFRPEGQTRRRARCEPLTGDDRSPTARGLAILCRVRPGSDQRPRITSRTSLAVSLGVRPTRTPTFSSASFLACAVPADPEMIAPAWPIVLPSGAVNPAT